jgi:hypothetical protein
MQTIYMFLEDDAFIEKGIVGGIVDKGDDSLLVLDDQTATYFYEPSSIRENSTVRKPVNGNFIIGDQKLTFDASKVEGGVEVLKHFDDNKKRADLIKIIEMSIYKSGKSLDFINTILREDSSIYIDESLRRSTHIQSADAEVISAETILRKMEAGELSGKRSYEDVLSDLGIESADNVGNVDWSVINTAQVFDDIIDDALLNVVRGKATYTMPEWVEFRVRLGETDEDVFKFMIWTRRGTFKEKYPLSTICGVVSPIEPFFFLQPDKLLNPVNSVSLASSQAFSKLNEHVGKTTHTGIYTFTTRYVLSEGTHYNIAFGIPYRGAVPEPLTIRAKIREFLMDSGLTTEEHWKSLFPDLWIIAQFFMVPIWDNKIKLPDNAERYPSVQPTKNIATKMVEVFPDLNMNHIEDYKECVNNSFIEAFTYTVPDPLNDRIFSIKDHHPTYQAHGPDDPSFMYQELKTRDFATKFTTAISILMGRTEMTSDFQYQMIQGRKYLAFASDYVLYAVLHPDYYDGIPED